MSHQFKIEKGIEIAGIIKPRAETIYPLGKLEIGDSFFIADGTPNRDGRPIRQDSFYSTAKYYGQRHGKKFSIHGVEGGFRVWRTA